MGGGSMDDLYRGLEGLNQRLRAQLAAAKEEGAAAGQRQRRQERIVAREENVARERTRAAVASRSFESDLGAERRLRAEEGIARAKQEQARADQAAARQRAATGFQRSLAPQFPFAGPNYAASAIERYQRGLAPQYPFAPPPPPPAPRPNYAQMAARMESAQIAALAAQRQANVGTPGQAAYTAAQPPRILAEAERRAEGAAKGVRNLSAANMAAAPAWREHGALSTEFFSALRRGEVTMRELGWQLGMTSAKFGGWLLAGAAIFGVIGAVRQLGEGAMESLNGVVDLQRIIEDLDTEEAQRQFRTLSAEMNLPIADVAEAAYGISKVFGDIQDPAEALNATMAGTRAALFAMKVGELDAASATRYFTAIIQGFKLDWRDLGDLTDYANQAQNRFGGSLPQIIQGTAQAAGQFGALGGEYKDLISLIQTGTRVTGRTGSELGTAIQRSAEILTRPERRQRIIELLGIDPADSTVTEVFERAMEVVRTSSREVQTEIARTISTPQLASGRILPVLRAGRLFDTIRSEVGRSFEGSAQRELDVALSGPREQIAKLGIQMQSLGSTLAQSGFLEPLRIFVGLLNTALGLANSLLEPFTHLPRSMRGALAVLVEMAVVMRLLRFIRPGGTAPGLAPAGRAGLVPTVAEGPASSLGSRDALGIRGLPFEERMRRTRIAVAESTRTLNRFGVAGRAAGASMRGLTTAATGFAAGMRSLAMTPMSGLDAVVAGSLVVIDQWSRAKRKQEEAGKYIAQVDQLLIGGTADQIKALKPPDPSMWDRASGVFADILNSGRNLMGNEPLVGGPAYRAEQEAYEALQRRRAGLQTDNARGVGLTQDQIRRNLRERLSNARTREEREEAISRASREADASLASALGKAASPERKAALAETRDIIAQAKAGLIVGAKDLQATLDAINTQQEVEGAAQELANTIALYGGNRRRSGRAVAFAVRARELAARAATPSEAAKLIQQAEQLEQAAMQEAQEQLDRDLAFARNPAERTAARQTYLRTRYSQLIGENRDRIRYLGRRQRNAHDRIADIQKQIEEAEAQIEAAPIGVLPNRGPQGPGFGAFGPGNLGQMPAGAQPQTRAPGARAARLRERIKRLRAQLESAEKDEATTRKALREAREEYRALEQREGRAQFQENMQTFTSRTGLLQSRTADPLQQARVAASRLREAYRRVRSAYGRHQASIDELQDAEAEANRSAQELAQRWVERRQSRRALDTARFSVGATDEQVLRRRLDDARKDVADIRSRGRKLDPTALMDAQRQVYEIERELAQNAAADAENLLSAQEALALSRTEDPIKQAEIRLRFARAALREARTPGDRMRARAEVNNARRSRRQTRQQEAYEEIQFEASIGKLEREAEIGRLRQLLKTIKGNRDLRRQIRQRIYQLQQEQEQDVELNVGSIRLPTLYDIRRMAQQGTQNNMRVQQSNVFHISGADDPDAVASAVFTRMAKAGDSGLKSAQRAAGIRG
jgi:TP901 family phage tail tape measure protein